MADTLARALLESLEANGYGDPGNEKEQVRIIVGLDSGTVLRGIVVPPDFFMSYNGRSEGGQWPDPGDRFPVPLPDDSPLQYLHLIDVSYLGANAWVAGSTARINIENVIFTGEKSR